MDKNKAHDLVHQWNGGKSENCPACNGSMEDSEVMAEAKKIAMKNATPRVNPDLPYSQRMNSYAELDAAARDNLDDSSFAYIDKDGGKHLPINDAAHVRNALARFNQTQFESESAKTAAMGKIKAAAKKFGVDAKEDDSKKMGEPDFVSMIDLHTFAEKGTSSIPSVIKVIPVGKYKMNRYGDVNITKDMIQEMKQHFEDGIRAGGKTTGLPIDIEHGTTQYKDAAAGWIKNFEVRDDGGYAHVDWTPLGKQLLKDKIYKFYSPEYWLNYTDAENTDIKLKNVMTGGGLVNKPMIKHDLNPIVNAENSDEKNLTNNESTYTIFLEQEKSSHENMQLSEIVKKAKADRTSEEQKFLVDNKDQLTLAEAREEGLLPTAEKKEEKGTVTLSEAEVTVLREQANAGAEAAKELKLTKLIAEVKAATFSEKDGAKIPTDQVEKWAKRLMTMSEDDKKETLDMLKALPGKQVFTEKGTEQETSGSATGEDLHAKAVKFAEEHKVPYATALSEVAKQNPEQMHEYSENLPVAQAER